MRGDLVERTELSISDRELVAVLDSMHEGFQIIGHDFRYRYVNRTAAAHGQRRSEELIGRTMMECYPGVEKSELFALVEHCMLSNEPTSTRSDFESPEGEIATLELRIEPCSAGVMIRS